MTGDLEAARRVKSHLLERLSADSRLRGIGLTPQPDAPGSFSVVVRVTEVSDIGELDLPAAMEGVAVQVAVVGDVVAWGGDASADELGDVRWVPDDADPASTPPPSTG